MGRLAKALERPSAYAVKKTDWWAEVVDRIDGCLIQRDIDDLRAWLDAHEMDYPGSWDNSLDELLEKKREQIAEEDIGWIIRDRFDF